MFTWISIIFLLCLLYCFKYKSTYVQQINKFPSIITFKYWFYSDSALAWEIVKSFERQNWNPFKIWMLHKPVIFIADPENMKTVLTKAIRKGDNYACILEEFGESMLTSSVDTWRTRFRLLQPVFGQKGTSFFVEIYNKQKWSMIKYLDDAALDRKELDIHDCVQLTALKCICDVITEGCCDDISEVIFDEFKEASRTFSLVNKRFSNPILYPSVCYSLYKRFYSSNTTKDLYTLPRKLFELMIKRHEALQERESEFADHKAKTLAEVYNNAPGSDEVKEKWMINEILGFIVGGNEDLTTAICFNVLMLAMHQDIQELVYNEIKHTLEPDDENIKLEQLEKLRFLDQCINETLRLFPTVYYITRCAQNDIHLKDGRVIPANTNIFMSIFSIHRNANVYKDYLRWDPHRFSTEVTNTYPKFSFLPFLGGPRVCPGSKYGFLAIKYHLCVIIRRYKISTRYKMEDMKLDFDFVLRNDFGYPVCLTPRI